MEVTTKGKLYLVMLEKLVKEELEGHFTREELKSVLTMTKKECDAILMRTPEMGGEKNVLLSNMYFGAYLIALYRHIRSKIKLDELGNMIQKGMKSNKMVRMKAAGVDFFSDKYQSKMRAGMQWAKENQEKYPWTWQFNIRLIDQNSFRLDFTKCGLCELCRAEGTPELTPLLCATDFLLAEMSGCKLKRTKTLAQGADCCDFVYQRK